MRNSKAACIIASWSGDGTFRVGFRRAVESRKVQKSSD